MVLDNIFNFMFGWLIKFNKLLGIVAISLILNLIVTLAAKFLSDQKLMKSLKEEGEYLKEEMKKFKNDPQKYLELQKKQMESSLKYMRHSMKPALFTLLPLLLIFGWLRKTFPAEETLINLPFSIPLIGNGLGWLGIYILSSIIFSIVLRKLLKIH